MSRRERKNYYSLFFFTSALFEPGLVNSDGMTGLASDLSMTSTLTVKLLAATLRRVVTRERYLSEEISLAQSVVYTISRLKVESSPKGFFDVYISFIFT